MRKAPTLILLVLAATLAATVAPAAPAEARVSPWVGVAVDLGDAAACRYVLTAARGYPCQPPWWLDAALPACTLYKLLACPPVRSYRQAPWEYRSSTPSTWGW